MSYDGNARRDTPLAAKLKARIRDEGPITIADYMSACLHDDDHGYYRNKTAIGGGGDFITAPEISQVFGELIGLWCVVVWQQMGTPKKFNLVELGPGRGTLMRDALHAAQIVPAFMTAADVHLVEVSQTLLDQQIKLFADYEQSPTFHGGLDKIPSGPTILVANEFLDTVPAGQIIKMQTGWFERCVGLDRNGDLCFITGGKCDPGPSGVAFGPNANAGAIAGVQLFVELARPLARLAKAAPLAALFIDYGHTAAALGDTLQAVRNHASEHPLTSPGEADLTVQVDFESLTTQFNVVFHAKHVPIAIDGPLSQAEFLGSLGIIERASKLMAANPAKAGEIEAGVARLLAPQGMGGRFKAIGMRSSQAPPLPGFPVGT